MAGEYDYFLKIRARDIADFNRLQGQKLIALPGVRNTRTFFVMKEVKDNVRLLSEVFLKPPLRRPDFSPQEKVHVCPSQRPIQCRS